MRLVLFTRHYPYKGETFLEDEIRFAEHYFDRIIIVTADKNANNPLYYIPKKHFRKKSDIFTLIFD